MVSVDPRIHGYSPERTTQFLALLRERVAALPGVVSVAATDSVPLSGGNRSDALHADGQPQNGPDPGVELYMATPGYFETLGIPRLMGRDFGNESPTAPKVAIINEALAEHLYGRSNPIGRTLTGGGATYHIIGVVKNIKSRSYGEETRYVLFRSLAQNTGSDPSFLGYQLLVQTSGDPGHCDPGHTGADSRSRSEYGGVWCRDHAGTFEQSAVSAAAGGHAVRGVRIYWTHTGGGGAVRSDQLFGGSSDA